ncbi:MAG TPA: LLM class flavin-dependent oxidoreductase [Streptosporangiaceae bacterium]|nr:LLM class flavin-dependent oxidoreductase [Streptosporangiaceae bacterium]
MGDYGHDLEFGVFITPAAAQARTVTQLAVLADQQGLDLVTFQDHPYQPAFLDTWTLLSYVAARTERVRLAPNVLNLPLRPPSVLARAVASLDLLSGGRAELGIGAGAFWDAIEAMGGRRLAPADAVDALTEAIEVIRGAWDAEERTVFRVDGKHYQVHGAKRGPAPAHRVSIWVGAYKPRMLRLTGRIADGWLPSMSYLRPGQLAEGNAIIDEAAVGAGRDPAAVRRLLNIGADDASSPERLAELALRDGIGTFILAADDTERIRWYAAEVAPAVRELVAAARRSPAGSRGGAGAADSGIGVMPTPDDGVRLSSTRIWDESTRPIWPAPAPPPEGYPAANRQASAELVAVHNMLRQELSELRELITQVKNGEVSAGHARSELNEMTIRQNNWTMGAYCESYCRVLTQHHGIEDAMLFPRLRSRDGGLGPVLDRLSTEHRAIHQVLDEIDQALVRYIKDPDSLGELEASVDLLTDALLSHLSYEERELLEPLARYGFW